MKLSLNLKDNILILVSHTEQGVLKSKLKYVLVLCLNVILYTTQLKIVRIKQINPKARPE